jgi:hypothetical protein
LKFKYYVNDNKKIDINSSAMIMTFDISKKILTPWMVLMLNFSMSLFQMINKIYHLYIYIGCQIFDGCG